MTGKFSSRFPFECFSLTSPIERLQMELLRDIVKNTANQFSLGK